VETRLLVACLLLALMAAAFA